MARGNKAVRSNGFALIIQDGAGEYAVGDTEQLPLKL